MKLSEWLTNKFTHITFDKQIGTIVVPDINIDLTVGLISTSSKEEFAKLCFHYAPLGTIIDEIDNDWYEGKVLAVRNLLAKKVITEPKYKYYLDILERRDKDRWSREQKQMKLEHTDNSLSVTFDIV
jgi:hypothetical protein